MDTRDLSKADTLCAYVAAGGNVGCGKSPVADVCVEVLLGIITFIGVHVCFCWSGTLLVPLCLWMLWCLGWQFEVYCDKNSRRGLIANVVN